MFSFIKVLRSLVQWANTFIPAGVQFHVCWCAWGMNYWFFCFLLNHLNPGWRYINISSDWLNSTYWPCVLTCQVTDNLLPWVCCSRQEMQKKPKQPRLFYWAGRPPCVAGEQHLAWCISGLVVAVEVIWNSFCACFLVFWIKTFDDISHSCELGNRCCFML